MARTKNTNEASATTAQSLGNLIKSCRDIMRKDKGLNGDVDRLPMLTWILFLKFLDDLEQVRETEASLEGKRYRPAIEAPYRWRDWAAQPDGITGDALIAFINQDEATRPDGTRGPGLFATLRSLTGGQGTDRRDVIRAVFTGTSNRMLNGYLLRDMVNKVNGIHFTSSEEISTLGHLYESMLKEMRDAAGDSGEFYTPRALVKFIVAVTDPRLGETVLDPACGTGGFLTESFEHLKKQCRTTEDHHRLQRESLYGVEAKPLPYLLCQMNLLLHGLESPQIDPLNALRNKLGEIGDRDRVDVILTNPPFGGEEQRGILGNFPADKQTAETALLFLQLIMRKLRRQPRPGRAAVVVPNGTLSSPGVAMRIRQELLTDFNVRAIVRLPHNVFAPYTDIRTNVLFFDRGGPTTKITYCEPALPDGVSLSKMRPLQYEWLAPYVDILARDEEDADCWLVDVSSLDDSLNLDLKNPRIVLSEHQPAVERLENLTRGYSDLSRSTKEIWDAAASVIAALRDAPVETLGRRTSESDERIGTAYVESVRLLGVSNVGGFSSPKTPIGQNPERYKIVRLGYLAYNPMRINIGSIGVATDEALTGITSPDYVVFSCHSELLPEYVYHYLRSEAGRHEINQKTKGSVRFRLYYHQLALIPIPVPDIDVQVRFAELCRRVEDVRQRTLVHATDAGAALDAIRREAFLYDRDA